MSRSHPLLSFRSKCNAINRSTLQSQSSAEFLLAEGALGDVRLFRKLFRDIPIANSLHVVSTGTEVLNFVRRQNEYADAPRPDVILLNWQLPDTNGREVLATLNREANSARIPIIVITGTRTKIDQIKDLQLGAGGYLTKPITRSSLLDAVLSFEGFELAIIRGEPVEHNE